MSYFPPAETSCKCGCGLDIRPELRAALEALRASVGFPLPVVSGARCPERNRQVGGATSSLHLRGLAADIDWPDNPAQRWFLVAKASQTFSGLGFYEGFLHIDLRTSIKMPHSLWVDH